MEQVIIKIAVRKKLERLLDALIQKGYFAIIENADAYVEDIVSFIYTIPKQQRSNSFNTRYGTWFCRYKPNKHTTWYITFDTDEKTWLIRNIFNNHGRGYATFLRSIKKL